MPLSDEQIVDLRQRVATLNDGRCTQVDADGCRCMVRQNKHKGGCDFPWSRWDEITWRTPRSAVVS